MYQNPSYLGGLAEIEPHYFRPTTPEYLQPIVSNTPFDRGDGIPTYPAPRLTNRQKDLSGCGPCQAMVRNPLAMSGPYGFTIDWSKLGTGENLKNYLNEMPKDQKDALASSAVGKASLLTCEKFGLFCPTVVEDESTGTATASAPIGLYITLGIFGVAVLGLGFYAINSSKKSNPYRGW